MNNDTRKRLKVCIEELKAIIKIVRADERGVMKTFDKLPDNLKKSKLVKAEKEEFLLDDAACCIGDGVNLLKKAVK